ncbi:MAG TPA: FGGY family carbohydrate kinase, partial [Elusimicrobiota bacterium]|nr:FGGY family carbohydrate kinase [Elusimicrobiota bacterium]
MRRYIAAIDQGTTSTRFIVFDRSGRVVASAQKEHAQACPEPGWVEHDAEEIWRRTREVIAEAMSAGELRVEDIAAAGITNQRETVVVWDRETGAPIHHALVWQDMRVQGDVEALTREGGIDRLRGKTGLPLSPYFSALKLKWILDHAPDARRRAASGRLLAGTIDSYLAWRLTGVHVTDVTNASRTQLMDLRTLAWDSDLLKLFDVPREILPKIASSSESYGEMTVPELRGVPLAGILGDQQAALFGQACFTPG